MNTSTATANLPATSDLNMLSPCSGGGLQNYLAAAQAIPLLSPEKELELTNLYRDENDLNAAQQLVLSNLRFVVHIARKYKGYGLPLQDLIQEGNIGLMRAVQKFDPSYGVRLISFAAYWIKAEIHEFIMRNWRIVKVSTTRAQRKLFFKLRSLFPQNDKLSLSRSEAEKIADLLDVKTKDVLEMETRMTGQDISLDALPKPGTASDFLQPTAEEQDNPELSAEDEDWQGKVWQKMRRIIARLDDRSRDIIGQRWMQDEKTTLDTLAKKYAVSIERIRQIEKAAIANIRTELKSLIDSV